MNEEEKRKKNANGILIQLLFPGVSAVSRCCVAHIASIRAFAIRRVHFI